VEPDVGVGATEPGAPVLVVGEGVSETPKGGLRKPVGLSVPGVGVAPDVGVGTLVVLVGLPD